MTSFSESELAELIDKLETIYQHMNDDQYDQAIMLLSALLDDLDPTATAGTECTCGSTDGFHDDECPAATV